MNINEFTAELSAQISKMVADTIAEKVISMKKIPSNEMDLHYNTAILDVMFEIEKLRKKISEANFLQAIEKNMK